MPLKMRFGFVALPLAIFDDEVDLSLGEYRLLSYLLHHRFRISAEKFRMTQDELLHGAVKADGSRRDKGCKITSPRDLKLARERLVDREWISFDSDLDGGTYEILLHSEDLDEDEKPSAKRTRGRPRSNTNGVNVESAKCIETECETHPKIEQNAPAFNKELRSIKNNKELPKEQNSSGEKIADPRWNEIREDIKKYWAFKNPDIPMPWAPLIDGKAVSLFLQENPLIDRRVWQLCLNNRSRSEVPQAIQIHRWIRELVKFSEGEFDRFGNVKKTNGGQKSGELNKLITNNDVVGDDWLFSTTGRSREEIASAELPSQRRPLLESSSR